MPKHEGHVSGALAVKLGRCRTFVEDFPFFPRTSLRYISVILILMSHCHDPDAKPISLFLMVKSHGYHL